MNIFFFTGIKKWSLCSSIANACKEIFKINKGMYYESPYFPFLIEIFLFLLAHSTNNQRQESKHNIWCHCLTWQTLRCCWINIEEKKEDIVAWASIMPASCSEQMWYVFNDHLPAGARHSNNLQLPVFTQLPILWMELWQHSDTSSQLTSS